jgi:glycosyltransferase involved in cell wall biosynthesis
MKIAFIGQKGIPAKSGGVEKHVEQIAVRLAKEGHEVYAYVRGHYTPKELKEYQGVHLIHVPSFATKHLDAISHTLIATFHALTKKYDVIHYHSIGPSMLSFIPRFLKPYTLVLATFHSRDYFHQKWNIFARTILQFAEWMVCALPERTIVISETLRDYAEKKYNRTFDFIPNGAEVVTEEDPELLKQWGLKSGRYVLLQGRLVAHKGVHYAVKAFQELEKMSKLPNNFKFAIVGGSAHTDEYVQYLRVLTESDQNIVMLGEQTGLAMNTLWKNAALFVQPSEDEGLSLSLLEAMGHGLLPIVSNIPANMEAIDNGKAGVFFENKNAEELGKLLAYYLNNTEERELMSKKAKERATLVYSWDAIAERTFAVYEKALANKKKNSFHFGFKKMTAEVK